MTETDGSTEPVPGQPEESKAQRREIRSEIRREALTMALYIALSLLAVMVALPAVGTEDDDLALTVLFFSLGLILAHRVAFRMSSRLVAEGSGMEPEARSLLRAQLIGGAFVTIIAVVPLLIFGADAYPVSMAVLLLFVMIVGYHVARSVPVSRARALLYVVIVLVVVIAVLGVKTKVPY